MTTKNNYGFKSVFADELTAYVDSKVAGGFHAESYTFSLKKFDEYCIQIHLSDKTFTVKNAADWLLKRDDEAVTTHYSRVNTSKNFLKYLALKGYDVYVVRDVRFIDTDFRPHIYTDDEVKNVLLTQIIFSVILIIISRFSRKYHFQVSISLLHLHTRRSELQQP